MVLKVASRNIAPFMAMDVLRDANEREDASQAVYHLEVGQPGADAPAPVLQAACAALDAGGLGYTEALGIPELRRSIADHYAAYYGVSVDAAQIVVTTGSSGGFVLAFLSAFDTGDRIAMVAPGYPCYRSILSALDLKPVVLAADAKDRFQPTPELLERAQSDGPIDGLIVASPSNPTGTMLGRENLRALADYCARHGIRMISDEVYHGITYETKADTALAFSESAVVLNSFSKYYAMTGWRVGWMVVPADLLRSVECLAQHFFISAPTLSQRAALAAFGCRAEYDRRVEEYRRNRDLLLRELPRAGFAKLAPADGAFYIYADVGDLTNDSDAFCRKILAETGVAMTPGLDFDPGRGGRFLRVSYAGSYETVARAARTLVERRR